MQWKALSEIIHNSDFPHLKWISKWKLKSNSKNYAKNLAQGKWCSRIKKDESSRKKAGRGGGKKQKFDVWKCGSQINWIFCLATILFISLVFILHFIKILSKIKELFRQGKCQQNKYIE